MPKLHSATASSPILWWRGLAWLALLAPVFFTSYSLSNLYAESLPQVGSVVFAWERYIPLLPWSIVPYWSIDLLYGLAFLLPRQRSELDTLGRRLLTVQLVCISCFFLWPLRFAVDRPELNGVFGAMFDVLMGFDKPYNQAPSLHIALLVVLWACYSRYIKGWWRWLVHGWFTLIGLSVLTTWQHHFIDVPTGVLAGFFSIWCWPDSGRSPLLAWRFTSVRPQYRLASYYLLASMILGVVAAYFSHLALILIWPAVSLLLVAFNYAILGAFGMQKQDSGRQSLAASVLFAPYLLGAWLNSKIWTVGQKPANEVVKGIWLGRRPSDKEAKQYSGLLDLCPELPVTIGRCEHYWHLNALDLVPMSAQQCWQAAQAIQSMKNEQCESILVYCALGYSRSCVALMAWLLLNNDAKTPKHAKAIIEKARPQIVIKSHHLMALQEMMQLAEFTHYQSRNSDTFSANRQQCEHFAVQSGSIHD